jgi:hypothetical protein
MRVKKIIILVLFHLVVIGLRAQTEREAAFNFFKSVVGKYQASNTLRFEAHYSFADVLKPLEVIDSLNGEFLLDKHKFWYRLDSTEVVSNDSMTISVFHEDHLIYIQPGSSGTPINSFIDNVDSVLHSDPEIKISLHSFKDIQLAKLVFPSNYPYRFVEYEVDRRTGFLQNIRSELKSNLMYDPTVQQTLADDSRFVLLTIEFKNYQTEQVDASPLDQKKYVTKKDKKFQPSISFVDYQIFTANPDL